MRISLILALKKTWHRNSGIPSWSEKLKDLGLNWQVVSRDRWNDYSNVDAIFAVRNFKQASDYKWKPASKLVNAWARWCSSDSRL